MIFVQKVFVYSFTLANFFYGIHCVLAEKHWKIKLITTILTWFRWGWKHDDIGNTIFLRFTWDKMNFAGRRQHFIGVAWLFVRIIIQFMVGRKHATWMTHEQWTTIGPSLPCRHAYSFAVNSMTAPMRGNPFLCQESSWNWRIIRFASGASFWIQKYKFCTMLCFGKMTFVFSLYGVLRCIHPSIPVAFHLSCRMNVAVGS